MNPVIIWTMAIVVVLFHFWASRRSPKHWYLGGIVPLIWLIILGVLWTQGGIDLKEDWRTILFPTVILILVWIQGQQTARKREMGQMKARDLRDL